MTLRKPAFRDMVHSVMMQGGLSELRERDETMRAEAAAEACEAAAGKSPVQRLNKLMTAERFVVPPFKKTQTNSAIR